MRNNKNFKEAFKKSRSPFILDGAIGSLVQQKGFSPDEHLWSSYINFKKPDLLKSIHQEYINAGCDIITSNTFRTNPAVVKKAGIGLDVSEAVKQSIKISKEIAEQYDVWLAGSNPPAEDCYQSERTISRSELEYNHKKHIELLFNNGADFILNETQSHADEIFIICDHCCRNKIPYCLSIYFDNNLEILSGQPVTEIFKEIKPFEPLAILVNCISRSTFFKMLGKVDITFDWGFYLNCGSGKTTDKEIECGLYPVEYQEIVRNTLKYNPKIIGSCCGSDPSHTKAIARILNG